MYLWTQIEDRLLALKHQAATGDELAAQMLVEAARSACTHLSTLARDNPSILKDLASYSQDWPLLSAAWAIIIKGVSLPARSYLLHPYAPS